jgi:hypothetical protein
MLVFSTIGNFQSVSLPFASLIPRRTEVAPWVLGVSGSVYRKADTWAEAKSLYNARLSVGAVKILV